MLRKSLVLLLLIVTMFLVGCNADASADIMGIMSNEYKGEFVDGDPQRRSYTFTGLSGNTQEILTVDSAEYLSIRLELASGMLGITVYNPQGKEVFSAGMQKGVAETVIVNGPLEAGTYTMILDGQQADGRVLLFFLK